MSQDTLRVAIVGCHRMLDRARNPHNLAAAVAATPGLTVVGVADRDAATRSRFLAAWDGTWDEVRASADHEELLRATRPDIVVLANSPARHDAVVEAALDAGTRGILCDKPLATTMRETDRILSLCRERKVPFALALDRRWSPVGERLRGEVASGLIGNVVGVALHGVPELVNHGCHWFDVALGFCGESEPVWGMGEVDRTDDPHRRLDPPGRGLVGLANGAVITVATGGGGAVPSVEVLGTTGRLLILNWYLKEAPAEAYLLPGPLGEPVNGTRLRRIDLGVPDTTWPHGPAMVADLVARMRDGGRTACDTEHARRATECGFVLHASHRRGGAKVEFPLADRALRVPGPPWGNDAPAAAAVGSAS
jgi:predicted dehydrogenase